MHRAPIAQRRKDFRGFKSPHGNTRPGRHWRPGKVLFSALGGFLLAFSLATLKVPT